MNTLNIPVAISFKIGANECQYTLYTPLSEEVNAITVPTVDIKKLYDLTTDEAKPYLHAIASRLAVGDRTQIFLQRDDFYTQSHMGLLIILLIFIFWLIECNDELIIYYC